jgi:SAM-dependent methyltransferase
MNRIVRAFVTDAVEALELSDPIVEFGALQVDDEEGADLRDLFPGRAFTGTDFRAGPGVDRVEDLRSLGFADGSVGTAICLETLEHCEDPIRACSELARVVAPGGVLIASTPMLIGIHAHPNDYFRFTPEALRSMLSGFDDVWVGSYGEPAIPYWVFAIAARGRSLGLTLERMPRLAAAQARFDAARGEFRIGPFHLGLRSLAATVVRQLPRVAAERAGDRGARALAALRDGRRSRA